VLSKKEQTWYSKHTRLATTQFCKVTSGVTATSYFTPFPLYSTHTPFPPPHPRLTQLNAPKASRTSEQQPASWSAMSCSTCTTRFFPLTCNYSGSELFSQPSPNLHCRGR